MNCDCVGEGLALALRAAKAGHEVKIWFAKENNPETGTGFKEITRVDNWLSHAKWADLIIPTGNHCFVPKFDQLRKAGMKVFGPTVASAALEIERAKGMEFFEDHDIEIPSYKTFASLEEAEEFVRKTGQRFVFKTLGSEDDKSLSYVSKSPADMIARLQRWQKLGLNPEGEVMLQEVIDGVEIGVSRFMGSKGWVGPPNENWENKKFLSGNYGMNVGESGSLLKFCAGESKLFDQVLGPLEKALIKLGHLGDIDVNCIVSSDGKAYPLEFCTRMGWPAENLLIATTQGDPIEWMLEACEGKDTLKVSTKVCCGVVVAQPDYPYSEMEASETTGIPIYGITKINEGYLYPQSVMRAKLPDMDGDKIVDREIWATTGDYIMVVTGQGRTVRQACTRVYDTIGELHIPDMMVRDDIGERLEEEIPKLQAHGYCSEWKYE